MKGKIFLMLMAIAFLTVTFATPVKAAAKFEIYGYVDDIQYMPGDEGTLKLWIYNDGTEDLILKKITVEYPWHDYYIWEGNETMKDIDTAVTKGENWSTSRSFTVPKDSRAVGGFIHVWVETDKVSDSETVSLDVASPYEYFSLQSLERIITLLTILAVLVIVCTVILAATIFLSARRPQVTWAKEEKTG